MPFVPQQQERCAACDRIVYATEKVVVETKEKKFAYHKTCIRCAHCNQVLTLGTLVQHQNSFYCKPHFKQLFSSKGNYDEGFGQEKNTAKWEKEGKAAPVTPPTSFVPQETTNTEKKAEKKETSDETAAKIRAWRQDGDSELCSICSKVVYMAEKLVVEESKKKKFYHKTCFKCSVCDIVLDLRNYGAHKDKIYCKNHLKEQLEINKPAPSSYINPKASFIPEPEKAETQKEKSETPDHIKEKFRTFSSQTEKCTSCGKTVYATERIIVEELKVQKPYHKNCLRCSHCNVLLDLSTYGSSKGVIYCLVHLKEIAKPQRAKDTSYFISPLKKSQQVSGQEGEAGEGNTEDRQEERGEEQESARNQEDGEARNRQEEEEARKSQEEALKRQEDKEEEARKSQEEALKRQEEAEARKRQEEEKRAAESSKQEQQTKSSSSTEEDDIQRRKREREERRRQLEEEEKREEEERQRKAEERRRRLEALRNEEKDS